MRFELAMEQLRQGKYVWRDVWSPECGNYIRMSTDEFGLNRIVVGRNGLIFMLSGTDLLAIDWMVSDSLPEQRLGSGERDLGTVRRGVL